MQIINRCKLDKSITRAHRVDFRLARAFVKGKLPGCNHYLITSFFNPPIRKKRTTLVPPILRKEILSAPAEPGDHLLVYQTSTDHDELVDALQRTGLPCRVYGLRRGLSADLVEGNLTYRPFGETSFIDDLRTARGVVASAGFTLAGECVYLRKPLLAIPLRGQFEQVLNARYLEKLGYGKCASEVTTDSLDEFLKSIPSCENALARYHQDGNQQLFGALASQLDRCAAGLRAR